MLVVHLDMILIIGLTSDGDKSITGKILRYEIVFFSDVIIILVT